jgi:hypothetical protein
MKRALFAFGKFAVKIGGQPGVDFFVNRSHRFNPLKQVRGAAACARTQERAPKFLVTRR